MTGTQAERAARNGVGAPDSEAAKPGQHLNQFHSFTDKINKTKHNGLVFLVIVRFQQGLRRRPHSARPNLATTGDKEARKKCAKEIAEFEAACSSTWVKYFKEKRVMEYNRDKTIERIKKEDAATVRDLKSQGWSPK
ncbi:hypothetical protein BDW60DRAFT_207487 [Aspergillus nidulans var. acristatus]